jgi:hypothetical protein
LRRIIRAFAIRTASVLGVCFFDSRVFVSVSAVGIMRNCMGAIKPCSTGCTLMGPVDVDLFLGIIDNALLPRSFDGPFRFDGRRPAARRAGRLAHDLPARFAERILSVDRAVAGHWGDLMAQSRRSGVALSVMDGCFAATALVGDFTPFGVALFNPWDE